MEEGRDRAGEGRQWPSSGKRNEVERSKTRARPTSIWARLLATVHQKAQDGLGTLNGDTLKVTVSGSVTCDPGSRLAVRNRPSVNVRAIKNVIAMPTYSAGSGPL